MTMADFSPGVLFLKAPAIVIAGLMILEGRDALASTAWGTGMGGVKPSREEVIADFGPNGMNGQTLRLDAKATALEPREGSFQWAELDERVSTLVDARVGIDVLLIITGGFNPPAWMCRDYPKGIPNPDLFADYFLAVMTRYSAAPYHLTFFEVYNEPNYQFAEFGSNQRLRADHYAVMLEKVWLRTQALRQRNPSLKLVGGSTAGPPKSVRAGDRDYFDQLWNVRGAHRFMDIYSFHTYIRGADMASGGYVAPEFPFGKPSRGLWWSDILVPASTIDWHGKPVWLTELGYDSAHASLGATQEIREANQARWEVRAAIACRGAPGNFVRRFLQFNAYSDGKEAYGFRHNHDGAPKLQWHAWKTLNNVLDDGVASVEMQAYYRVSSPATNHCSFKYTKNDGHYGWAVWWVPEAESGSVVLGDRNVTGEVFTRGLTATTWTRLGRFDHAPITITATNDPLYVEVR
jgi:hypothetical protein